MVADPPRGIREAADQLLVVGSYTAPSASLQPPQERCLIKRTRPSRSVTANGVGPRTLGTSPALVQAAARRWALVGVGVKVGKWVGEGGATAGSRTSPDPTAMAPIASAVISAIRTNTASGRAFRLAQRSPKRRPRTRAPWPTGETRNRMERPV